VAGISSSHQPLLVYLHQPLLYIFINRCWYLHQPLAVYLLQIFLQTLVPQHWQECYLAVWLALFSILSRHFFCLIKTSWRSLIMSPGSGSNCFVENATALCIQVNDHHFTSSLTLKTCVVYRYGRGNLRDVQQTTHTANINKGTVGLMPRTAPLQPRQLPVGSSCAQPMLYGG